MDQFTQYYLSRAEFALLVTLLAYFTLNGAQIFETTVLVPRWTAAPPASLSLLKGVDLKTFWIIAHSLHEITFMAAIVVCWHIVPVRNWLLILFALHFAVRVWTLVYFAPHIIAFQKIDHTTQLQHELAAQVRSWKQLNLLRVGAYVAISIALVPLFYKVLKLKAQL